MARETFAEAPDHYEILDRRLVGRLAGVLFVVGGLLAALLLALEPPVHPDPAVGWAIGAALVLCAFVCGGLMLATTRILPVLLLVLISLSGPTMLGTLQWLSGPASAFDTILALSVVWAAVVLPGRWVTLAMAYATAVLLAPLAYGGWDREAAARHVAELVVLWVLGGACLLWSARMRDIRRELAGQRAAADQLARVDALTGLGNRRALDEALAAQIALANRSGRPLAALVGDLDGFKAINDHHGHHAGDAILCAVAHTLRDVVRGPDACFRWGGDEFVVLLPETALAEAREIGRRISAAVHERCLTPDGRPVTLPLGAAERHATATGDELLAAADSALLLVKGAR